SQADLLAERVSSEAAAAVHPPVERAAPPAVLDHQMQPRADGRTVRLPALQRDRHPVVAEARVLEQDIAESVARVGAAELLENILVAVIVEVRKGHAMALLQVAESTGGCDVREARSSAVVIHGVGDEPLVFGKTGAQVEIEPPVVVEIAEVRAHRKIL